jgi:hypothetical protein
MHLKKEQMQASGLRLANVIFDINTSLQPCQLVCQGIWIASEEKSLCTFCMGLGHMYWKSHKHEFMFFLKLGKHIVAFAQ